MPLGQYSYNAPQVMRFLPGPQTLAIGGASANIQLLPNSFYRLWANQDCFFDLGPSNAVAATTNSHPMTAKLDYLHYSDATNIWLAVIQSSNPGTLYISQFAT